MADPKPISRDQLAKFLPDHETIRRFERLFNVAGELTPAEIARLDRLIEELSFEAGAANTNAVSALAQLVQLAQDAALSSGAAENRANQALDALTRIAKSLEALEAAPPAQEHGFLRGDYIDLPLDGPHVTQERRIQWNKDDGTLDVGLFNGVTLQVGQETHYYAKNTSGATIPDGASVMATGTVGASGKLTIAKAVADGSVPSRYMIGIASQEIANNAFGYITAFGLVRGIDTTGTPYGEVWADGDLLYFSPTTAGGLTKVKPTAPQLKQAQAIVVTVGSGGSGSIFVRMERSDTVEDLDDVHAPAPAAGAILIYDATQLRWEAARITAGTNVTVTNSDGAITLSVSSAAPSGAAGGALSGTYPNPGFAVDMATQAELDAHATAVDPHSQYALESALGTLSSQNANNIAVTGGTVNGATVGATTPAAGSFTNLSVSSTGGNVLSSTWTPTLTKITNLDAVTAFSCQYMRVGNVVTVGGRFDADATAAGAVELAMSLPVASNFTAQGNASGTLFEATLGATQAGVVLADPTNDRLSLRYVASLTTNRTFVFHATYVIL